jgi:hypothetical protein
MRDNLAEWRRLVEKYKPEYFARTESPHPKPPRVKHAFSCGIRRDGTPYRYWAFTEKEDFDHFIGLYRCTICHNPAES